MLRSAKPSSSPTPAASARRTRTRYFIAPPLFAVADGMGGAQAGEVASHLAVEAFADADPAAASPEELLRLTIKDANRRIFDLAQGDASRSGMGTTLTAALLRGDEISFGHVGDSRAYVLPRRARSSRSPTTTRSSRSCAARAG